MKILVINQNTCNFGDDAAGVALMQQIESTLPTGTVSIVYSNHSSKLSLTTIPFHTEKITHRNDIFFEKSKIKDTTCYLICHFLRMRLELTEKMIAYINIVRSSDVIIVSPCGSNIGIYQDWQFLLRVLIPVLEKKKVVFHLNTIDKSNNIIFNFIAKYILKRSAIYVRENI